MNSVLRPAAQAAASTSTLRLLVASFGANTIAYAALPYFLGLAAKIDASGGSAAAVAGAYAVGHGLLPGFGASIIGLAPGYLSIFLAIAAFTLLGGAAALFVDRGAARAS